MFSVTLNGQPAYRIRNLNDLDVFKFDRRVGCQETNTFTVTCERNGSAINILLAGGGDTFNMSGAPAGVASVAGGFGSDRIIGHTGETTSTDSSATTSSSEPGGTTISRATRTTTRLTAAPATTTSMAAPARTGSKEAWAPTS